jgi:endoglucanase
VRHTIKLLIAAFAALVLVSSAEALTLAPGRAAHWRVRAKVATKLVVRARASRCARRLTVRVDRRRPVVVRIGRKLADHQLATLLRGWHHITVHASAGGCHGGVLISWLGTRRPRLKRPRSPSHPQSPTHPTSPTPPRSPAPAAAPSRAPGTSSLQPPADANPFAGPPFYIDPGSDAARTEAAWRAQGKTADANAIAKIANNPQAQWFGDWDGTDPSTSVHDAVARASATGALPVLVAYNIPGRDCGSYSAGGASSAAAYRAWINGFSRGIGSARAVVIIEPDALAELDCMSSIGQQTTLALLRDAVATLAANPGTAVYLDAGHFGWQPAGVIAARLVQADIGQARGFSLNVSNFDSTANEESYGNSISSLVGGKHFLIDTSRNGQGPPPAGQWCNPAGRGLGQPATTATGDPLADALFWVKAPGESDGSCNGGPSAGTWWPDYALGLAQRAAF